MTFQKPDATLDLLQSERDDLAVKVSLAWDADPPDLVRLGVLQRRLHALDRQIARHRPNGALNI